MKLDTLINNLKLHTKTWELFFKQYKSLEYSEFFSNIDKFFKEKGIYISHGYSHETLLLEYVIYHKGEVIDLYSEKTQFVNPYWDTVERVFNYLETYK